MTQVVSNDFLYIFNWLNLFQFVLDQLLSRRLVPISTMWRGKLKIAFYQISSMTFFLRFFTKSHLWHQVICNNFTHPVASVILSCNLLQVKDCFLSKEYKSYLWCEVTCYTFIHLVANPSCNLFQVQSLHVLIAPSGTTPRLVARESTENCFGNWICMDSYLCSVLFFISNFNFSICSVHGVKLGEVKISIKYYKYIIITVWFSLGLLCIFYCHFSTCGYKIRNLKQN